eukprot:Tbor_TRINITY_DN5282_c1_g2::TRINITY_DN5282_c1_g2_i6::g.16559::m.16559
MPYGEAKLFVGQLHLEATVEDVRQLFEFYGSVLKVNIPRQNGKSKGSAFVTYGSTEEADTAILALHDRYNMQRDTPLQVSYCQKTGIISKFGHEHAARLAMKDPVNPMPRKTPCNSMPFQAFPGL